MTCTVYSLFQFSYLHAFYKLNNIITKLSLKVKSYFQRYPNKATDKYSTLDQHGAFSDEFNANFVLLYFSILYVNENLTPLLQKCKEKATRECIKTSKHFQY